MSVVPPHRPRGTRIAVGVNRTDVREDESTGVLR